jgi:hypothetical protein
MSDEEWPSDEFVTVIVEVPRGWPRQYILAALKYALPDAQPCEDQDGEQLYIDAKGVVCGELSALVDPEALPETR